MSSTPYCSLPALLQAVLLYELKPRLLRIRVLDRKSSRAGFAPRALQKSGLVRRQSFQFNSSHRILLLYLGSLAREVNGRRDCVVMPWIRAPYPSGVLARPIRDTVIVPEITVTRR